MNTESPRTTQKIVLEGKVDDAAVVQLQESIGASTATAVVVDAGGVTFIDSACVDALLDAKDQLEAAGRELRVVRRTPMFNKLLDMAGMGEAFV